MSDQQANIDTVQVACLEHRIAPNGTITLIIDSGIGVQAEIQAGIFTDNHEPTPPVGTFSISSARFDAWFKQLISKEYQELSDLLYDHFNGLMAQKDKILSDPDLFMLGARFILSGTSVTGGKRYPIGPLLRDWERSDMLKSRDGKSFIISVGGSLLSGANSCLLWNPEQGLFHDRQLEDWSLKWKYLMTFPDPVINITHMRRLVDLAIKAST
jgi:hypothetical protein